MVTTSNENEDENKAARIISEPIVRAPLLSVSGNLVVDGGDLEASRGKLAELLVQGPTTITGAKLTIDNPSFLAFASPPGTLQDNLQSINQSITELWARNYTLTNIFQNYTITNQCPNITLPESYQTLSIDDLNTTSVLVGDVASPSLQFVQIEPATLTLGAQSKLTWSQSTVTQGLDADGNWQLSTTSGGAMLEVSSNGTSTKVRATQLEAGETLLAGGSLFVSQSMWLKNIVMDVTSDASLCLNQSLCVNVPTGTLRGLSRWQVSEQCAIAGSANSLNIANCTALLAPATLIMDNSLAMVIASSPQGDRNMSLLEGLLQLDRSNSLLQSSLELQPMTGPLTYHLGG